MPRTASITSQALAGLGLSSLVINTIDNPNAFDTSEFDDFGWSVAIDGDRAIVGAYREDDAGGTISGKAYIFNTSTGALVHTLNNPNAYSGQFDLNPTLEDQFGYSVAISGNRAIVSAPGEDETGSSGSGKAYIFDVTTGEEVHTLDNPNAFNTPDNDRFGIRVGISGNYAIASAYNEDDAGGVNSGKAYIFDVTTGNLLHTLDNPDPDGASQDDNFGNSIGISGDYAIVGAPGENDGANDYSGNAYIFDATDGSLVHTLTNPNPVDNSSFDRFGDAVAISGNRAIVGARTEDGSVVSTDEGKAYIYDVITGQLLHTLDNPDTVNGVSDNFGYSVAISGNFAIVGTPLIGITSGKAYIFNASTGTLIHTIDNPNAYGTPTADRFGESVAISGNRAIVSAYGEDELDNLSSGKAYLIGIPSNTLPREWILEYTIDNPNAFGTGQDDTFGQSVAIDGNYAIVGAQQEDDADFDGSGKAYIFDVTTGNLLHTLDNPNPYGVSAGDTFGNSVAISGNYAIVGAYQEDGPDGFTEGKAYIYNVTTGNLLHTLDNPNAFGTAAGDRFGWSVAISGNYAIAGASWEDDESGSLLGKAYIFDATDGSLVHTLDNPNPDGVDTDVFGEAVAIDGDYAIVGATGEAANEGKAYIFDVTDGSLVHTLDSVTGAFFGQSVSISGDRAIVGSYNEDSESGKAYIFDVTDGSLVHTLTNPNAYDTSPGDRFGYSVSISGNYAIVGAYGETDANSTSYSGKAYIYNVTTGELVRTLDNPNAVGTSQLDYFGFSVAIDGDSVIVGAYAEDDDATITYSGKAYTYKLKQPL